ncbi:hypothetical protein TCAL_04831 [Tigriopus californicus]|uniref:UBX domain-containing protein n=2 Tax=Tigriopus californicus TaxID=6832 RepID=A0A553NZ20_TIGCA|nr:hypothetical protein TCAL_04831 [Tigriopus californicus]|eukprot:TCALIF_04831-PA protein Name:"Similar to UBXN7 UBX domain-containing protein 7 (Pongo abelii)" AED:0.03 eAED:0.03 QI:364/1/1/1/1/1/5/127/501
MEATHNGEPPAQDHDPALMDANITQFCSIIGCEPTQAKAFLELSGGSLAMAINMHMEGVQVPEGPALSGNASPNGTEAAGPSQPWLDDDGVRAPIPQKRETLVEAGYEGYRINKGAAGAGGSRQSRVRTVFDGFRNFNSEAKSYGSQDGPLPAGRGKKPTLEELFKPPLDIMYKGDWPSARESAAQTQKWLLVNIQDPGEFQCQMLNRDVWSSIAVKTIVREHFVFWQQYKESEDAQRYMAYYPIHVWPHVAVLDPRTGESLVTWNKILDASCFCDLVAAFLHLHPSLEQSNGSHPGGEPSKKKLKKNSSIIDADEDSQLAAAIQASLSQNTGLQLSSEVLSDDSDVDVLSDNDTDDELDPVTPIVKVSALTEDPNSNTNGGLMTDVENNTIDNSKQTHQLDDDDDEKEDRHWTDYLGSAEDEKSHLLIRFPDGKREKKDLPCSSPFIAIIKYIVGEGYTLDSHEIVTNFPRRVLTDLEDSKSLKDLGLFPKETIFIQQKS